jgi:hypothetical protein
MLFRMVIINSKDMELYYQRIQDPEFKGALISSVLHVAYRNKMNLSNEKLHIAAEMFLTQQIAMFFPKTSCLIQVFDTVIIDIVSSGLIDIWANNIVPPVYRRSHDVEGTKEPQKLTLYQLRGAYKLYGGAIGVSAIVFLLELLSKRVRLIRKLIDYWQNQK